MSYKSLRDFIKALESEHELIRIQAPVSSQLEITEITDRVSKSKNGGKALLFENVDGSSFPLLINAFGSAKRIALALETKSLDLLAARLQEILTPTFPKTLKEKFRLLKRGLNLARCFPRIVKMAHPPCQEVIFRGKEVDLAKLPILKCWPHDGGPFITLPVVFTKSLKTGQRNTGMYRMQIFDKNTTGMHWHAHKDGAHFFREYEQKGQKMEAAVAIGTDPALTYVATAPLPPGIDEILLAGFIRGKPLKMVPAVTVNLEVPAEAEFILEGYINPLERRLEGPFGDHTGYYSLPDYYPVFHVTALTHRKNATYSTIIVGRPPMEDCYLGLATERIFLPLLRTLMPEITDYCLPWEGVFHNLAIVSINKEYPGQAQKVIYGLWGSGQMSFCKIIVVVDSTASLDNRSDLLKEILSVIDLERDVFITDGILDALDHASPNAIFGGKLGVDATGRLPGEPPRQVRPANDARVFSSDSVIDSLKALDDGYLDYRCEYNDTHLPLILLQICKNTQKRGPFFRDLLLRGKTFSAGIVILYDKEIDIYDDALISWKALNNVDPRRDILIQGTLAIIDATVKSVLDGHLRPWPDELINNADVKRRVDDRWEEYGITT